MDTGHSQTPLTARNVKIVTATLPLDQPGPKLLQSRI